VQVLLDYGTLTGSAAYTLSAFHDSSVNEFGFQNSLAALLSWQAMPTLRLTLSEAFLQTDDPERTDRLLLTRERREATSNQSSLTSDFALLGLDTKQYYRLSQFSSTNTTTSHTFGLSASRALDRIHVLTGGYEYLMSDTTSSGTVQGGQESSIIGHQVSASFSRDLSALMTAGITGAYATRNRESATGQSSTFNRWNIGVFTNYTLAERLILRSNIGVAHLSLSDELLLTTASNLSYWFGPAVVTVGAERGFSETFAEGQDLGVVKTTAFRGSVLYRFSPLLTAQINASYRENEQTEVGGTTAAGGQNDTVYSIGVSFSYQILRGLTASLEATHTESEGREGGGRSFTENRVRAALSAIFY
jgi:hypothetical protein